MSAPLLFSTFEVTSQAFYRTALSYAIVNLKPIVPGRESSPSPHSQPTQQPQDVLVIPTRVVPRLTDLSTPELTSLITSVQHVGRVIEKAYSADSLTVACQVQPNDLLPARNSPLLGRQGCRPVRTPRTFPYPSPQIQGRLLLREDGRHIPRFGTVGSLPPSAFHGCAGR